MHRKILVSGAIYGEKQAENSAAQFKKSIKNK
jgi:hypothetical protein